VRDPMQHWAPQDEPEPYPTVLVAADDEAVRQVLVESLWQDSGVILVLNEYRPRMHILLVTRESTESQSVALALDAVLARTHELLKVTD